MLETTFLQTHPSKERLFFSLQHFMIILYHAKCDDWQTWARQIGFQRLDETTYWQLLRLVSPEIIVCCTSLYMLIRLVLRPSDMSLTTGLFPAVLMRSVTNAPLSQASVEVFKKKQLDQEGERWAQWLMKRRLQLYIEHFHEIALTILLGLAGIIHPSAVSAPYFLAYLLIGTFWATNRNIQPLYWYKLRKWAILHVTCHLVALYLYQFPTMQRIVPMESFIARFLGLTQIIEPYCQDINILKFSDNVQWPVFVNPIILMTMYGFLAVQIRSTLEQDMDEIPEFGENIPRGSAFKAVLLTSEHLRSGAKATVITRQGVSSDVEDLSHSSLSDVGTVTPPSFEHILDFARRKATTATICTQWSQASDGHVKARSRRQAFTINAEETAAETGTLGLIMQFATSQSYVVSLFMMMAWSIIYHSWLTFVLLLISCVVWMYPDSRKFCLRISPFIVIYAEILLMLQFIWGLSLTQEELPDENPPFLRQLGLEKPREYPAFVSLLGNCIFTTMFWVTLRQYIHEQMEKNRNVMVGGVGTHPFHVAFTTAYSDVEKPMRQPSSVSQEMRSKDRRPSSILHPSPKIQQFAKWMRRLISKYWVVINLCLLLLISLQNPVVAYRVVYMAFFLLFVNCFQISFPLWRKFLYTFWMIMVVYCMTVLTLIYTYQFHGFPELWENSTGVSDDVLQSIGLEQFSRGRLLIKLLTPISFLIFTLIQVNFFHSDLIERTRKWEQAVYPSAWSSRTSTVIQSFHRKATDRVNTFRTKTKVVVQRRRSRKRSRPGNNRDAEESSSRSRSHSRTRRMDDLSKSPKSRRGPNSTNGSKKEPKTAQSPKRSINRKFDYVAWIESKWNQFAKYQDKQANLCWRFMEIHIDKFIAIVMLALCISEVSAANIPFIIYISLTLPMEQFSRKLSYLAGIWTSLIIIAKMLYQMKFVKAEDLAVHCTDAYGLNGTTIYAPEWGGLHKTNSIFAYSKGYVGLTILLAFRSIICMRQKMHRKRHKKSEPLRGVLFSKITREDADKSLPSCLKYFVNYFFYKFGLEICYFATIITIGLRSDCVAIAYAINLIVMLALRRPTVARVWPLYTAFLAVSLSWQYFICVGIPPSLCKTYPWTHWDDNMVEWLFLPDFAVPPNPIKLIADFFQFLCVCSQLYVFKIEMKDRCTDYPGGSNRNIVFVDEDEKDSLDVVIEANSPIRPVASQQSTKTHVADFISYSKSHLDLLKVFVFVYFYWVTLAIVFIAGVSHVTLFAMGYVIGCFIFLWVGNSLFLKPLTFAVNLWNAMIFYNVGVMFIKISLQVVGCVYMSQMYRNYCWVLQLFGIACLKTGVNPAEILDQAILGECNVPHREAGIFYDGLCFLFLLIQRRIISSHYFKHVIAEFRAQQIFASRGAELIAQITQKEVGEEQEKQEEIMTKVKRKMDRIKQKNVKGPSVGSKRESADEHDVSPFSRENTPHMENLPEEHDLHDGSFPIESFDDILGNVSLHENMSVSPSSAAPQRKLPVAVTLASPTSIREKGVIASINEMQRSDESVPVVSMDEIAPLKDPSPTSPMCHIVGPSVLLSPHSQHIVPFLTTPDPQSQNASPNAPRKPPLKKQATLPSLLGRRYSKANLPSSVPEAYQKQRRSVSVQQQTLPSAPQLCTPPPPTRPKSIIVKSNSMRQQKPQGGHFRPRTMSKTSDSKYSSNDDLMLAARAYDGSDESDMSEIEDGMATMEEGEDRRKGLGPLQLLNVAFKKGKIKDAVVESKAIEHAQEQLEKEMEQTFGVADHQAIRRAILRRKSRRAKADFDEATFNEEAVNSRDSLIPTSAHGRLQHRRGTTLSHDARASDFEEVPEIDSAEDEIPPPYGLYASNVKRRKSRISAILSPSELDAAVEALAAEAHAIDKEDEQDAEEQQEAHDTNELESSEQHSAIRNLLQYLAEWMKNTLLFMRLFGTGVLESMITWLLRISRDYRYVAQVLAAEKRAQKELFMELDEETRALEAHKKAMSLRRRAKASVVDVQIFIKDDSMMKLHQYLQLQRSDDSAKVGRTPSILSQSAARNAQQPKSEELEKMENFEKQEENIFFRLFVASYYLLISRSELFCYLLIVLNHMASASLITMPIPLMTFLWGTLSVPRPSKRFWITVITYTEAMIVIKYIFQFGFFPWNKIVPPPDPFWLPRLLGIEKKDKYAAWDLALLMTLFFHRSILKTVGLWKDDDGSNAEGCVNVRGSLQSYAKVSVHGSDTALETTKKTEVIIATTGKSDVMNLSDLLMNPDMRNLEMYINRDKLKKGLLSHLKQALAFFRTLLNPKDRYPVDVYAPMFVCDFICFFIVIFGYSSFGTDQGSGGVAAYFEENKVPGAFLAMLIVQFTLIVIDRALFLRKFLFGKLIFQITLVLFVHTWMFIILPAVTERLFTSNTPCKLWYFTKVIYFAISAKQIRSGYPTRSLGNMITNSYTAINWLLYKIFMWIPFLFELRSLMDWIWTDTSLGVGDWLMMNDIYMHISMLKCERKIEEDYPSPKGAKKRPILKYGLGGALLFGVILIIWFPLVFFSLANTVGTRSLPIECTTKLTIGGYQALFQSSAQLADIRELTEAEYDALHYTYRYSKTARSYMADYDHTDVVKATINGNSTSIWGISPPARRALLEDLNSTQSMSLKFEWYFKRAPDDELQFGTVEDLRVVPIPPGSHIRSALIRVLHGQYNEVIRVPNLFPPFVKVPGEGKAEHVYALLHDRLPIAEQEEDLVETTFHDVLLELKSSEKEEWWRLRMIDPRWDPITWLEPDVSDFLVIIGFADKVFPATFSFITGGGILGLYVSLVLVVGRFIRMLVTGAMQRIMFEELPNVDRILQLCLDIFLVREAGELELEEDLFAKLVFLFRSPATLIKWTKEKTS
uniref:Piezo-type mechanosensitive ion channel component n=1 Tax=Plectus sambesii TaxID=2011161 RepID=A0A914W7L3_9BILA